MQYVGGIDVSRYQGTVDWKKVFDGGYVKFAAIRATVGDYYQDPRFEENYYGAREAGIYVGAYHVIVPTINAISQFRNFYNAVGEKKLDLGPIIDVELDKRPGGDETPATPDEINDNLSSLMSLMRAEYLRWPTIYTGAWFWNSRMKKFPSWGNYSLWVADYSRIPPLVPVSWETWTFWQYSSTGTIVGIDHLVDLDYFNGSESDLYHFVHMSDVLEGRPGCKETLSEFFKRFI